MEEKELDVENVDKLKENLREAKFLKRIAEYRTIEDQMNGVEAECKELGKDVRDTFHVVGTEDKGDATILHIVTSGKEGEESARQTLTDLAEAENVDIENKSTMRYDEENDREMLITEIKTALKGVLEDQLELDRLKKEYREKGR